MRTLTPVVIQFDKGMSFDSLPKPHTGKAEPLSCTAIGFIESDDGDFIRLIYLVENDVSGIGDSEQSGIVIPKENVLDIGLPFDVEVVDYLDHATFSYLDEQEVSAAIPWECTAYGRIQEENDDFIRLVVYEEISPLLVEPKEGGIIILKSTVSSRETFKEQPPDAREPLRVHV